MEYIRIGLWSVHVWSNPRRYTVLQPWAERGEKTCKKCLRLSSTVTFVLKSGMSFLVRKVKLKSNMSFDRHMCARICRSRLQLSSTACCMKTTRYSLSCFSSDFSGPRWRQSDTVLVVFLSDFSGLRWRQSNTVWVIFCWTSRVWGRETQLFFIGLLGSEVEITKYSLSYFFIELLGFEVKTTRYNLSCFSSDF